MTSVGMVCSSALVIVDPGWPPWVIYLFVPLVGVGYAIVDLMPWSMVGEVIDEDELRRGERREGVYNGVFTFLRKLGGAVAVAIVLFALGTGPIKGFAITLLLGIITSMFTAIVGTRAIVNIVFGGRKLQSLPV